MNGLKLKTLFPLLFLLSCTSPDETKKQVTNEKNKDTLLKETPVVDTIAKALPAMIYFKQDDCKEAEEKLIRKKLKGDTLFVEMSLVRDCGVKFYAKFKQNPDTVDILLKPLVSSIIKHKNGKIDSVYSIEECYCTYKFLIQLNHIDTLPKVVLVDGRMIRTGFRKK